MNIVWIKAKVIVRVKSEQHGRPSGSSSSVIIARSCSTRHGRQQAKHWAAATQPHSVANRALPPPQPTIPPPSRQNIAQRMTPSTAHHLLYIVIVWSSRTALRPYTVTTLCKQRLRIYQCTWTYQHRLRRRRRVVSTSALYVQCWREISQL